MIHIIYSCHISPSHIVWGSCKYDFGFLSFKVYCLVDRFKWGQRGNDANDEISSIEKQMQSSMFAATPPLCLKLHLFSAASFPEYTNYTQDFKDVLDYIFAEEDSLAVIRVAPFPTEEVLSAQTAIPSEYFPSDHLAVAVDLKLIRL